MRPRPAAWSCGFTIRKNGRAGYISCGAISSALSLVSELRWYIRRYVREPLFEFEKGIWFTHQLAQDVYYERTAVLGPGWEFRKLYGFREGKLISQVMMSPGSTIDEYHQEYAGVDASIEVWCTEDELGERLDDEPGSTHTGDDAAGPDTE